MENTENSHCEAEDRGHSIGCVPNRATRSARCLESENVAESIQLVSSPPGQQQDSVFFRNGVQRIDFVLSYNHDPEDWEREQWRKEFEANLKKEGLELETDTEDGLTYFLKIHAPWEVLATYADILKIKMPFKPSDISKAHNVPEQRLFASFCLPEDMEPMDDYFTYPFAKEKMDFFHIKDKDSFFHPATRNRIVYYILSCRPFDKEKKKKGIKRLLSSGTYRAAFPLHDGQYMERNSNGEGERFSLYRHWARFSNFYKKQPLNLIRKYYGEKIGIYFAWLGFYTEMLVLAAVVGLICFLHSLYTYPQDIRSKEVCDPEIAGKIVMCPLCDKKCGYWKLNSTCNSILQPQLFDNAGMMFFAVFMGIWATLFLEFWKRRQARLEYEWDLVDFEEQQQLLQVRPEYEEKKPNLSLMNQSARVCLSVTTVLFWMALILACVIGVIVYRLSMYVAFASLMKDSPTGQLLLLGSLFNPQLAVSVTASCINFVIIMVLDVTYKWVAIRITDMEIPKTHQEYENRLTTKMFLFQFVNYYSSCFYVAFFKGKFVGYPGKYTYMFGEWSRLRNEECAPGGCLIELTTQMVIVMAGKQLLGNINEMLVPWLQNWWTRSKERDPLQQYTRWGQDHNLKDLGQLGLFYEYLEMVIQFGFVTLFVASFPLAPLLALFNNTLEIRVDAWKFTTQLRRPVAAKAHSIGVWQEILSGVAFLSVFTNAFIVAFTSEIIPRLVYLYAYHPGTEPTMKGYINNSLSVYDISQFPLHNRPDEEEIPPWFKSSNISICRYRDYRYPSGHEKQHSHTMQFWHILAARLAFIISTEHLVFALKFLVAWLIPDVPVEVKKRVKQERHLIQEYLYNLEVEKLRAQSEVQPSSLQPHECSLPLTGSKG